MSPATFDWRPCSDEVAELQGQVCDALPRGCVPIYLVLTGSHSYGLATPESDKDFRGIYMPAPEHFFGLRDYTGPYERKNPDMALYSLRRFIGLALKNNPNILEMLFIPKADQLDCDTTLMVPFLEAKEQFLSRQVRTTYAGYAVAQLRKLKAGGTRNLGAKRKEIREKFGYDTKNAMHCLRLLHQGIDLLKTGELTVRLAEPLRSYLLDVRSGNMPYEDLMAVAECRLKELDEVAENSPLPEHPWTEQIEARLMDVQSEFLCQVKYKRTALADEA